MLTGSTVLALATEPELPVCETPAFSFAPQNRIGAGSGYEPGIDIDSAGNVWTTAHKLSVIREEGTRLSSFLHRSTDDGATFQDVNDLIPGQHPLYALEGDLAVDGNDRTYFVDTWAVDNHFYRFGPDGTLETARPFVPSGEIDDRPWLAAHQDGAVYYMSNTGYHPVGRLTIHRSNDRGETFDAGFVIPNSGWGFLDADPNSDRVYAVVNDEFYGTGLLGRARSIYAWSSDDRGKTWSSSKISDLQFGFNVTADHDDSYPTVAVSPKDGSVYALWTDNGSKVMLGRSTDFGSTWEVHDVTPFPGLFSYAWMTVAPNGDVSMTFEARATGEALQRIWAMQWRPDAGCVDAGTSETCAGPASVAARVNQLMIGSDYSKQADFFQTEVSPTTGAQHVVWTGSSNQIFHARSAKAPTMSGISYCGHTVL